MLLHRQLRKLINAYYSAIETYIAWNWHEREMPAGLDDSPKVDLRDIDAWVTMTEEYFGLYTIVPPGAKALAEGS